MSMLFLFLKNNIYSKQLKSKEIKNLKNYIQDNKNIFETFFLDFIKNFQNKKIEEKDLYFLFPNSNLIEKTSTTITYKVFFNYSDYNKCTIKKEDIFIIGNNEIPLLYGYVKINYSKENNNLILINKIDYSNIEENGYYKIIEINSLSDLKDSYHIKTFKEIINKNINNLIKETIPNISKLNLDLEKNEILINFEKKVDNLENCFNLLSYIYQQCFMSKNINITYCENTLLDNYIIKLVG